MVCLCNACLLLKPRCTSIARFQQLGNINRSGVPCQNRGPCKMTREMHAILPKVKMGLSSISILDVSWWLHSSLHLKATGALWCSYRAQQPCFSFTSVLWLSLKDHPSSWALPDTFANKVKQFVQRWTCDYKHAVNIWVGVLWCLRTTHTHKPLSFQIRTAGLKNKLETYTLV